MVRTLRIAALILSPAVILFATAQAQRSSRQRDGLVCVNPTRDWNEFGGGASLSDARDFLKRRVKPECPQLAERVRARVVALEPHRGREAQLASASAPRPEPVQARTQSPPAIAVPHPRSPAGFRRRVQSPPGSRSTEPAQVATAGTVPPPAAAPGRQFPADPANYDIWEPNWFQVVERFPELRRLYDRGSPDLCARCIVGESGYLAECKVAGAAASSADIREGTKLMLSMIHVAFRGGAPAAGASFRVPVHFGRLLPPPSGGYCRNPEEDFRS